MSSQSDTSQQSPSASTPGSSVSSSYVNEVDFDDVAIVGMGCRTAGGNDSPQKLWQFLMDKKDASGESPAWRWEPWLRRDSRNAKVIEKTINKGYFIQDLENFDASFFGISPKEAEMMDPHQRLGLEVTWEALENAGIDPKSLAKSDTAVYMGIDSDDYSRLLLEDLPNIEAWMGIGTTAHGVPNRISYHYDLMGPSAATDAACASSLVAVHSGRHAIMSGESRVAIVGGVNVCLSPALFHMLGAAGALSPDGVCESFDDAAHGYARGEGAAVLILKRLSHAIADGDRILATIKGVAVAQDGKTNGIMAPNAKAQEMVARQALKQGKIDPLSVGFIEAHATSTSLGDPTEISAIANVYGVGRPPNAPAAIGSIKPNVGHLEAAAGAISLVKAVMAVGKGQIPPQTRLNKLNTKVDWDKSGLKVAREPTPWREPSGPRRAAICSYGYGGTVSHAVIEQSPIAFNTRKDNDGEPTLLVISAPQERRLATQAAAQADWISSADGESLKSIACTLAQRRAQHEFRAAFVVSTHAEAADSLRSFANGIAREGTHQGRTLGQSTNKDVVWVFSGHGAQWTNMGKELLQNSVFREAIAPLDLIVSKELDWSAIEALQTGDFQTGDQIQVLTYLIQWGLSQVLISKGVQPHAIIGHSVGEIAASVVAGCLTPEEGALIVTRRARLYSSVRNQGGMYLCNLPFDKVAAELHDRKDVVAAIDSSPSSCVVSGATTPLTEYVDSLKNRDYKTMKVNTEIAFHSPALEPLVAPLRDALANALRPGMQKVKIYSTSQLDARSQAARDSDYWTANMVNPVWLTSAVEAAVEDGHRIFLEVSAHPIISHSVNEIVQEAGLDDFAVVSTMRKDKSVAKSILSAIAQLHVRGASVDFAAFLGRQWSPEVPGFQWAHKPYWKQVSTGSSSHDKTHDVDMHTMLGQRSTVAGTEMVVFDTKMEESNKPFPRPHELHGTNIIPAAVYMNTFIHATGATVLSHMTLRVPLAITDQLRNVQVVVEAGKVSVASQLSAADDRSWTIHSQAQWTNDPIGPIKPFDIAALKARIATVLPNTFSIDYLAKVGVAGIAFPWAVTRHYGDSTEMLAQVDNDPDNETVPWHSSSWAPTLDAASSIGSTIFADDAKLRIVSQIDRVMIHSTDPAPKLFYVYSKETDAAAADPSTRSADVCILRDDGQVLAKLEGLRLSEVDVSQKAGTSTGMDGLVHQLAWVPARLSEKSTLAKHVVLISNDDAKLREYQIDLKKHVSQVLCVNTAETLVSQPDTAALLSNKDSAFIYIPGEVQHVDDVASSAHKFICEAATAIKSIVQNGSFVKFYIITDKVFAAESATALAQGALYGLARVAALEHSDIWGGLIDNDDPRFPTVPFKYVKGQDVIRFMDGVPKVARFRPFSKDQRLPTGHKNTLLPKPEGTYIVTGGLGDLGLETCDFLVEKGARRIVIFSRRSLPPRSQWTTAPKEMSRVLDKIMKLEKQGATFHVISLDISAEDASQRILDAVERLSLPPVLGVIHASGVLEDSLLVNTTADSFRRVLAPKISGALALHRAFPPGTLDFFVLYSSIGQLVGTSGQSSYGSGNAFLDTLAAHRRNLGDNSIAFQFTAWRGLGMGASTDFLTIELKSKGITDITRDEGFRAWEYASRYDTDHAIVSRVLQFEEGELLPTPLLEEVAPRRAVARVESPETPPAGGDTRPTTLPELKIWLSTKIREAVGSIMMITDIEEIDPRVDLNDMGVDSVMSISLRTALQNSLKVKVPQTLTWNYPTVTAMVDWFATQFESEAASS